MCLDLLQQVAPVTPVHENVHVSIKLDQIVDVDNIFVTNFAEDVNLSRKEFCNKVSRRKPFVDNLIGNNTRIGYKVMWTGESTLTAKRYDEVPFVR